MSASEFRKLIDSCSSYSELIPYLQIIVEQPINKEFGNSCLHALAFLTQEHLTYSEWLSLFTKVMTGFTEDKFDKSTYPSLMRVYCNPFGYQFLETQSGFKTTIENFLDIMVEKGITLRKRTLSPLIQLFYYQKVPSLGMSVLALGKVNNITFDSLDLAYLLAATDSFDRRTVVQEIMQTQTTFTTESIAIIKDNLPYGEYQIDENQKCGAFRIPEFNLSTTELKQIISSLTKKVNEKCRKNVNEAFQRFCKSFKKNITAVVDGANVGRFQQGTKSQGALNYIQIKNVVMELRRQGHNVLVCLNENHFKSLTPESSRVLKEIQSLCQVRKTPSGLDDDLCWLYACLSLNNSYLITTDELRNHIYNIDSKLTLWKEYRRVTFNISRETGEVSFNYPLPYYVKPHLESIMKPERKKNLWLPITATEWTCVEI